MDVLPRKISEFIIDDNIRIYMYIDDFPPISTNNRIQDLLLNPVSLTSEEASETDFHELCRNKMSGPIRLKIINGVKRGKKYNLR